MTREELRRTLSDIDSKYADTTCPIRANIEQAQAKIEKWTALLARLDEGRQESRDDAKRAFADAELAILAREAESTPPESAFVPPAEAKRGPGRPKGAKNRPKDPPEPIEPATVAAPVTGETIAAVPTETTALAEADGWMTENGYAAMDLTIPAPARLYLYALGLAKSGRVRIEDRRLMVDGVEVPNGN